MQKYIFIIPLILLLVLHPRIGKGDNVLAGEGQPWTEIGERDTIDDDLEGTVTQIELQTTTPERSLLQKHDNKCYDLSGREIQKPVHGIYIKNGKKYILR